MEEELDNNLETKSIALLGRIKGDPTDCKAIAILTKKEFSSERIQELNKKIQAREADEYFHNSIFRKYWLSFNEGSQSDINQVQCNFMYPATEMLIAKYRRQQFYTVSETADTYTKVTKPNYVDKLSSDHV